MIHNTLATNCSEGCSFFMAQVKPYKEADGSKKEQVAQMFDQISGRYDFLNHFLSFGIDKGWRRRLVREAKKIAPERILDIATGTGRTLQQIRAALPHAELIGTDLSEAYLRQANRWLNTGTNPLVQLIRANGESLPLAEETVQAVTCVFLLHELPGEARQNVLNEAWRVLEPGGVFVLADSVQLADSPQFSVAMENFRRVFHEPFYRDYIGDDIDARLQTAGFEGITAETHFMTRVWSARKPLNDAAV